MELQEILSRVDHTCLAADATWERIRTVIDEGIRYRTASVCIPPRFVRQAAKYAAGQVKICTVVGFPLGYSAAETKVYEAWEAVHAGADEIDMVISIGLATEGRWEEITQEIDRVAAACGGKTLKVIIETCLLTREEKQELCRVVGNSRADFIKTSTGFSTGGATPEDVALLRRCCPERIKVKAAGGIATREEAERLLRAGADRLGSSRLVRLAEEAGLTGEGEGE